MDHIVGLGDGENDKEFLATTGMRNTVVNAPHNLTSPIAKIIK